MEKRSRKLKQDFADFLRYLKGKEAAGYEDEIVKSSDNDKRETTKRQKDITFHIKGRKSRSHAHYRAQIDFIWFSQTEAVCRKSYTLFKLSSLFEMSLKVRVCFFSFHCFITFLYLQVYFILLDFRLWAAGNDQEFKSFVYNYS